ncbi:Poly(U)-specific endoribonuclease [Armadillidium vulgare]|nr:Poly(U)-specific endoribonuclease [Armadillidium vulgare]
MGEIDDGIVKGFHNWISFYLEEQAGNIDYKSFIDEEVVSSELDLYMLSFNWDGYVKSTDSIWIGSTPELELAVYTICFYHKPNALCDVSMNGVAYKIQTYQQSYNGGTYVGSAYPDIS